MNWEAIIKWFSRRQHRSIANRDADAARELQNHLDLESEELRDASVLDPQQAQTAARRALGKTTLIREEIRTRTASRQLTRSWRCAMNRS